MVQGRKSEKAAASEVYLNIQRGSGCGVIDKEDLCGDNELCQVKSFRGRSISFKVEDLEALVHNASQEEKDFFFVIHLVTKTVVKAPRMWVAIPVDEWRNLKRDQ